MVSSPQASSTLLSFSIRWTIAPGIFTRTCSEDWIFGLCESSGKSFSATSLMSTVGYEDEEEEEMGLEEVKAEVASGLVEMTSG